MSGFWAGKNGFYMCFGQGTLLELREWVVLGVKNGFDTCFGRGSLMELREMRGGDLL